MKTNEWIKKQLEGLDQHIEELDFANAGLSDDNISFLCKTLNESSITAIRRFDLSYNNLFPVSAKYLATLKIPVELLDVSTNYFDEESYEILKQNKSFKEIWIFGNGIKSIDEKEPPQPPRRLIEINDPLFLHFQKHPNIPGAPHVELPISGKKTKFPQKKEESYLKKLFCSFDSCSPPTSPAKKPMEKEGNIVVHPKSNKVK